jgi:hypothetical protein
MATAAKHPPEMNTKTLERELSAENSEKSPVVQSLKREVANALVLYLNYKARSSD